MAAAPEPKSNLIVPESIRQILADHGRIMRVRKGHVLLAVGLQARLRTHCGSQKMTIAAMQIADMNVWAQRS